MSTGTHFRPTGPLCRARAGLAVAIAVLATGCGGGGGGGPVVIDAEGPRAAWAKHVADVNGDGRPDLIVGGHMQPLPSLWDRIANRLGLADWSQRGGDLVWYENPGWQRHVISTAHRVRTDVAAADIDGDGDIDVVALTDAGVDRILWHGIVFCRTGVLHHGHAAIGFDRS